MEIPVFGLIEGIARQVPAIPDIFLLPVISQIPTACWPPHRQLANRATGNFHHVVINHLGFIASNRSAGRSPGRSAYRVADKDMQHLRRTNPIQYRNAGFFCPGGERCSGQGFPSRYRNTQAG